MAVPFYFLGSTGLFGTALLGYIFSLIVYGGIQVFTGCRRPTNGVLVTALFIGLYWTLFAALSKAK